MDETAGADIETDQPLRAWWLGRTAYRDAWDLQHRLVQARIDGALGDQLLLLEHQPVLTLGRHSDPSHVRASADELRARGIELVRVERGGEVTYHGPGQLVAYTIVDLRDRGLAVKPFVHALEAALVETCRSFGVEAAARDGYPGCWCGLEDGPPRKIGAIGIRVERGTSYHGVALNVVVRLGDFALIDACGMPGVESTSIERERPGKIASGTGVSATETVAEAAAAFGPALARALHAPLCGELPPLADPIRARHELELLIGGRAGTSNVPGLPSVKLTAPESGLSARFATRTPNGGN